MHVDVHMYIIIRHYRVHCFHPDHLFSRHLIVQLASEIAKLKQQAILNEVRIYTVYMILRHLIEY